MPDGRKWRSLDVADIRRMRAVWQKLSHSELQADGTKQISGRARDNRFTSLESLLSQCSPFPQNTSLSEL